MTVDQEVPAAQRKMIRLRGQAFVDKVKELIHEGNVRRLVIKNEQGNTVMEIPVTAGVVAAVVAPVVTAIGAIAALANEWSIEVEHHEPPVTTEVEATKNGKTG
jgi:predicted regulator of Ras-like GTPase activity (Roadblock/LC7/MglB family)